MKNIYSALLTCSIMFLLVTDLVASDKIIYADDFNRNNNQAMGSTSTGGYTWADQSQNFSIAASNMYVVCIAGSKNLHAHVKYDLDVIENYNATLDVTMINSGESGSHAGLFLLPRTSQSTNVVGNSGWVVNNNFYDPAGSGGSTRFYWYDGSETNEWGSIPVTRLDTNQFNKADIQNITISVRGDYASLLVTQADGATLIDNKRYIGNYNTGEESVFQFAWHKSIDQTSSIAGTKPWAQHNIDNFVVSTPQMGTIIYIK